MGRNLPPIRSVDDPPWREQPDPEDSGNDCRGGGDECAVCGKPLGVPSDPTGPQFCENHDREDWVAQERAMAESWEKQAHFSGREDSGGDEGRNSD